LRAGARGQDEEVQWQAVCARANSDEFVYAVTTTGIYCRSGCPSRRPQRKNVVFFGTADEAERSGFRPCQRCRPQAPTAHAAGEQLVARLCRSLDSCEPAPTLGALAEQAHLGPAQLRRLFRRVLGLTPADYVAARRAARLRQELPGARSVTEAIYRAGYGSAGRFYEAAKESLGMLPATYRERGVGQTVHFATCPSSLGVVLVATTEQGVCAILIGDDGRLLEDDLRRRFARAQLEPAQQELGELLSNVVQCIEEPWRQSTLPLDLRGTALEQRVWQALTRIPAGQTSTYGRIAEELGMPRAARAIGRACGANPAAVLVPCHRVLRADGALGGYRWGLERKRALLAREREACASHEPPDTPRASRR
jgi:AraC family transcriptional regulator of adaptative response/methylated-DNA-[protein]-cysteine methyltransferase